MFIFCLYKFINLFLLLTCSLHIVATRDNGHLMQFYQKTKFTFPNGRLLFQHTDSSPSATDDASSESLKTNQLDDQITTKDLEEGSFCRREFDGRSGYCLLAYHCLHVMRDFRLHGTKIDVCTYRKNVPIICCPLDEKDSKLNGKRISARKCEEYNESLKDLSQAKSEFSGKKCVPSIPMIVGGEPTQSGEFPHMVALGWSRGGEDDVKWGCGASLISEQFVITAAHCTESGGVPPDIVRMGILALDEPLETSKDIPIQKIIPHPKYRASSYYHDIALIQLTDKVAFNSVIKPICLWQLPTLDIPQALATGWGRVEFLGPKSDTLLKVDLKIIDTRVCKKVYSSERKLPLGIIDGQFCAGHLEGGKDTCQGDSGGPIHASLPELSCVNFLIGITSFGKFCAAPNAPGVYTRIYPYLDWIERNAFIK